MLESHKVPIHLDVEEKFIFGWTVRQCFILGMGAALGWGLFVQMSGVLPLTVLAQLFSLFCGVVVFVISAGMAFFRLAGRSLEQWALVVLLYVSAPKWYRWSFNTDHLEAEGDREDTESREGREEDEEW